MVQCRYYFQTLGPNAGIICILRSQGKGYFEPQGSSKPTLPGLHSLHASCFIFSDGAESLQDLQPSSKSCRDHVGIISGYIGIILA